MAGGGNSWGTRLTNAFSKKIENHAAAVAIAGLPEKIRGFGHVKIKSIERAGDEEVLEALQILANHPLVGRPAEHDMRELIISRGHTGYLALYSYEEAHDTVLVLAIRHQREAGYDPERT